MSAVEGADPAAAIRVWLDEMECWAKFNGEIAMLAALRAVLDVMGDHALCAPDNDAECVQDVVLDAIAACLGVTP